MLVSVARASQRPPSRRCRTESRDRTTDGHRRERCRTASLARSPDGHLSITTERGRRDTSSRRRRRPLDEGAECPDRAGGSGRAGHRAISRGVLAAAGQSVVATGLSLVATDSRRSQCDPILARFYNQGQRVRGAVGPQGRRLGVGLGASEEPSGQLRRCLVLHPRPQGNDW
jgi:hypothetical protein